MFPRTTVLALLLPGLFVAWMSGPQARAADPSSETTAMLRAWKEGQRFHSLRTSNSLRLPWTRVLAFAPTGRLLAAGGDHQVLVWNTRDWSLQGQFRVEAEVSWLAFSPDQRWLYLAGTAAERPGLLARFDWQKGKLDRSYPGPVGSRFQVDLSTDGQRLALAQGSEGRLQLLDTQTGQALHSGESSRRRPTVSLGRDGKAILKTRDLLTGTAGEKDAPGAKPSWVLSTPGPERTEERDLAGPCLWQFSPTGRHLLSGTPSYYDRDGLTLRTYDASDLRQLARRHDLRFGSWLTFSGDGRKLVVANQDQDPDDELCLTIRGGVRFTLLSVPDLEVQQRWEVLGDSGSRLSSLTLSPDGRMLGVASRDHRWAPSLFDTSTGQRILPPTGHTGRISSVHFLPDGRTLRSIDSDGVVCRWDLPSMRLTDRLCIPTQCSIVSARSDDGKYVLCRLPSVERRRQQSLAIVDADAGCIVSTSVLRWFDVPQALWSSDFQAFLVDRRRVARIDCKNGQLIEEHRLDRGGPSRELTRSDWQPEQTLLSWLNADSDAGLCEGCRMNLLTGELSSEVLELSQPFRHYGAVPGGRWFYVADPDLVLIDRATMKVQARCPLGKGRIETLTFTPDGSTLAVACTIPEEQHHGPWPRRLIRIHDTMSGRTLAALPGAESIVQLRFSADGRRLAVVHDDDTIEVWDLPGVVRK